MEVCNPKGGRTATPAFLAMLLMMMIMMLLNAYCSSAAVLAKSNTSFRCSSGRLDECRLIEEDLELELELEFLMNPYVSRILADGRGRSIAYKTKEPNKPVITCGKRGDSYNSCTHKPIKGKPTKCVPTRSKYSRC
ncbi:hypothetical protein I3842_03G117300 [Carya illinoinensis]|uniref:Uncharacterized protein n=1 Tax=Carya illinoinensis TaxID=32201 RepID=A0A922FFG3_CARIL|nr:hypothetical protein I3842_03G117300 [Carya illinoinensis]